MCHFGVPRLELMLSRYAEGIAQPSEEPTALFERCLQLAVNPLQHRGQVDAIDGILTPLTCEAAARRGQ
jgi:hypothetical protein